MVTWDGNSFARNVDVQRVENRAIFFYSMLRAKSVTLSCINTLISKQQHAFIQNKLHKSPENILEIFGILKKRKIPLISIFFRIRSINRNRRQIRNDKVKFFAFLAISRQSWNTIFCEYFVVFSFELVFNLFYLKKNKNRHRPKESPQVARICFAQAFITISSISIISMYLNLKNSQ